MDNNVPDWNFASDTFFNNQKKPMGLEDELMELIWQNGEVVLNSQTNKKPTVNTNIINSRHVQKNPQSTTLRTREPFNNSSNVIQNDETVSWIQYPLLDHPLEQEFCSNLLSELPSCVDVESFKQIRQFDEGKFSNLDASCVQQPHLQPSFVQELPRIPMPAPRFNNVVDSSQRNNDLGGSNKVQNFSHFSRPPIVSLASANGNTQLRDKVSGSLPQCGISECPAMTVGSSNCKSNQVQQGLDVSRLSRNGVWTTTISPEPQLAQDVVMKTIPQHEKGKSEMLEPIIPSSSGGSGNNHGKTLSLSTRIHDKKRKSVDIEDPMEQCEDKEHKSGVQNKVSQRSATARRNRAAEVHNLSERKRRDRINEKMKALQQLIPHSNKTDKASMLDEAIEYLKSLQLQLQVLLMGSSGMAPMMHPGFQQYMSQMGMGMTTPSFPPLQNPMQIPRMPLDPSISSSQAPNPTFMGQNPMLGAFNFQNQMQNPALSEQFARYMSYQLMQNASQPMNMYKYGPQAAQHSQTMMHPSNRSGPMSGAANINDAMSGKMG